MIDLATGLTAGGSAAAIVLARDVIGLLKVWAGKRNGNGNGKEPPVQVNVGLPKETSHLASTTGKRICDYHVPLMQDISDIKADMRVMRGTIGKVDEDMVKLTNHQVQTHQRLSVILEHFHLSEYGNRP